MGNLRLIKFCCLLSGSTLAMFGSHAEAQQTHSFGDQSQYQQAYYQPLTQAQYRQHQQTAYAQDEYSDLGQNGFTQTPSQTIQQRAEDLLNSNSMQINSPSDFRSQASPFPSRRQASNVGFRRLQDQDDPFGESQAQQPVTPQQQPPANQFDPFADPPPQDAKPNAVPGQIPANDPFGEAQVPPTQDANPNSIPGQIPANDPFGEAQVPPAQNPPVQNPVENPSPFDKPPETLPAQEPIQQDPVQADPPMNQDPVTDPFADPTEVEPVPDMVLPESNPPSDVEYPPGTITPDVAPRQNETTPRNPYIEPQPFESNEIRNENLRGELYGPPTNVYRAPPAKSMPPIVQPNQYAPYQTQPQPRMYQPQMMQPQMMQPQMIQPQMAQPQMMQPQMAPPLIAPGYQSPYQPIPGFEQTQQPVYQQPAQPIYPSQAPAYAPQPIQTLAAEPSVYSPVVGQCGSDCQSCNECCPNFYFSLFAGLTDLRDLENQSGFGDISAENGEGFGVALGRRNGRNLRTEAEFSYRHNDFNGFLDNNLPPQQPFSGSLNSYAGMANAYWEFIDVPTGCFKPYVGVGIGFVGIDVEATDQFGRNLIPSDSDNDTSFAFQWMAGVNYKAYRNVDLFAEYRFFQADSFRIDSNIAGLSDRFSYETDNVNFGLRWKF